MTNSYSKFARFQYTSPADIGIENYNPTIYKMAVLAELAKIVGIKKSNKISSGYECSYSNMGNWKFNLDYEGVCDAILIDGNRKLLRDCYQSAFNEYVLLTHSEDWKTLYADSPYRYMIGECYTFGENEFHANGGLGTKIYHAWVETETIVDGKLITMVIDNSNNQSVICEAATFYTQWRIHSFNNYSFMVNQAIRDCFKKFPKKSQQAKIRNLSVFQIVNIDSCLKILEEDTIKQNGGILVANYIERLVGESVLKKLN
jgi:hypothetical protein